MKANFTGGSVRRRHAVSYAMLPHGYPTRFGRRTREAGRMEPTVA